MLQNIFLFFSFIKEMVKVYFYQNAAECYELRFLKNPQSPIDIICPDFYTKAWWGQRMQNHPTKVEVFTMDGWIGEQLKKIEKKSNTKSEIMISFAAVWRKSFSDLPPDVFFQSKDFFELLRGFSLDFNTVEEVLRKNNPIFKKVVKAFWQLCDQTDIIDGHASCSLISRDYEKKKDLDSETKNIIIWGFDHLCKGEVNLLEALSNHYEVTILFLKSSAAQIKEGDWIGHFIDIKQYSKSPLPQGESCRVQYFPKGHLNKTIFDICKKNQADIYLGIKEPDADQVAEVALPGKFFKATGNLIAPLVNFFIRSLMEEKGKEKIEEKLDRVLQKNISRKGQEKNFLSIKALLLIKQSMKNWRESCENKHEPEKFDWKIIEKLALMDCPRSFFIPLLGKVSGQIQGLEGLENFDPETKKIVCFTSDYSSLGRMDAPYSEEVLQYLLKLGPVKRPELSYQMTKTRLVELLKNPNSILLLEQNLEERNTAIKEVLDCFLEIKKESISKKPIVSFSKKDILKEKIKLTIDVNQSYSATCLQTYLDCPRQYYFRYLEDLKLEPVIKESIRAFQLGIIEHKVIKEYLEKYDSFDRKKLASLSEEELDLFCQEKKMIIGDHEKKKSLIEIVNYTQSGIEQLLSFKEWDPTIKFSFEERLKNKKTKGRVDCIARGEKGIGLFDFKRSGNSIPKKYEIEKLEAIQLWFYLLHSKISSNDVVFFGYLNLSDPNSKESMLFTTEMSLVDKFSAVFFKNDMDRYKKYEDKLLESMSNEKEFDPNPRKKNICRYCFISSLCPKGKV